MQPAAIPFLNIKIAIIQSRNASCLLINVGRRMVRGLRSRRSEIRSQFALQSFRMKPGRRKLFAKLLKILSLRVQ
jgi:hypothetical protein